MADKSLIATDAGLIQNPALPSFSSFITVKLSSENFPLWKAQVTPYLRAHGLFGFADGSKPRPLPLPNGTPAPDDCEWLQRDQLVLAILTSSPTEAVLVQVLDCITSAEVWAQLHELFAARSNTQIVQSRLRLASLKKGGDSVTAYYNKAKGLVTSITAAGQTVSDDEFVVYLLAGLDPEYESLVTSLSTQPVLPTPNLVLSHLLNHERRLSHQNTSHLTNQASLNNTQTHSSLELNYTHSRGRGNYRGRGPHRGRGGRFQTSGSDRGGHHSNGGRGGRYFTGQPDTRPVCQVCSKPGHTALKCYNRFNHSYQAPPPSSFQANFAADSAPWYPDTGASHHYTPDLSNLSLEHHPYDGTEQVSLGDGSQIQIHNHGLQNQDSSASGSR